MNKVKWMGLPIMGLFLSVLFLALWFGIDSALSEPPETIAVSIHTPAVEPPVSDEERLRSQEEMRATAEATVAAIQERARIAAQDRTDDGAVHTHTPHRHLTEVQSAPSYFPGFAFSELPRERRRQALAFNRRASEAQLIRELSAPGTAESLYNVTLLVFSRGVVHEANFMHRPCGSGPGQFHTACDTALDHNHAEFDGPAMFAVFRATRATGMTLLGSIRNHMRYVTEEEPSIRERSRWISELTLEGTRPPHFPETDAEGNPLNWERDYLPRWQQVIEMSRRLLDGHDLGPCAQAPLRTWGGRCEDNHGACDDSHGSHRGLVGMSCGGATGTSSNRFWCRPGLPGCVETDPVPPPPEEVASVTAPESTEPPATIEESSEIIPEAEEVESPEEIEGEPLAMLQPI